MQRLAARGNASVAAADEALASVAELELQRVERERNIAELEVRRAAAEKGVFMTSRRHRSGLERPQPRRAAARHRSGRRRSGRGRGDAGQRSPCRRDRCLGPGAHERRCRHRPAGQSDLERHGRGGHGREHRQPDRRVARLLGDAGRRARERHRGGAAPAGNGGRGGARGRAISLGRPRSCSPAARPARWGWTTSRPWRRAAPLAGVRSCCGSSPRPRTSPLARSASRPSSSSPRSTSSTCCAPACAYEASAHASWWP